MEASSTEPLRVSAGQQAGPCARGPAVPGGRLPAGRSAVLDQACSDRSLAYPAAADDPWRA